ncbi:MAG: class I SAM-dependent methyltransferase, partial [Candidatus Saganbacteria bacterium]|nr:class I SAM-dependent methyltransferase [Candidatus Saganbacteria bacterium]
LLRKEGFRTDIYDKYFSPEKVYTNKKYDLITATEVFEHLKDPVAILKLLKSHLNKNGVLAVMTLFHPKDIEQFKKWWYRRDSTHIAFYTPKTFEYMASLFKMDSKVVDKKNILTLTNHV